MRLSVEDITPDIAQSILENNPSNRPISGSTVRRYKDDMEQGRWRGDNGDTIKIATTGELLDGQHRLWAIVQSGMTFTLGLARDVDPAVFDTLDNGRPRKMTDMLAIKGIHNASTVASGARTAYNYVTGLSQSFVPSRTARTDFVEHHPDIIKLASRIRGFYKIRFFPGPLTGVMFLANCDSKYQATIEKFLQGLSTGADLSRGDPRLTLREWVSYHSRGNRTTVRTDAAFGAIARAWNAFATDRTITVIKKLDRITQADLPIVGFKRDLFPDVPHLERHGDHEIVRSLQEFAENAKKAGESRPHA